MTSWSHHVCESVQLSTSVGAVCECGKIRIPAASLSLKSLPMAEVRQVVVSAFKLAHGRSLRTLELSDRPFGQSGSCGV